MENSTLKQPEEMSQFFNVRSSSYDDHMKECIESFDEFYKRLSESIDSTEEQICVLDLGCGTGAEIKEILNKAPKAQIIAIDVSEKMLLELKKKYEKYINQISLIVDSYLNFSFKENYYDYVMSSMTMHHLLYNKKLELYKKIRNSLKDGGKYIEGDYVVSKEKEEQLLLEYHRKMESVERNENGSYHIDIPFSIKTQMKLFQEAGFSNAECIYQENEDVIFVASK